MKILFLGPDNHPQREIVLYLDKQGYEVFMQEGKLDTLRVTQEKYYFLISFGYRHIIKKDILKYFDGRAINFHISYLPWNRGADPNLWSILENTPKGVTIHQIDEGLDTGNIFCQKEIIFNENDTLESSYNKLNAEIVELFKVNWANIRSKKLIAKKQGDKGSYHKSADKNICMHLLKRGWKTRINKLIGKAENV